MKRNFVFRSLAFLVASLMLWSCASTTLIKTEAPGVKVYADGSYLGNSPVTYSDTKVFFSTTHINLKKEGCADQSHVITRNEEFQIGPCIGGFFAFGIPWLWTMGYKPERTLAFECRKP